MGWFEDLLEGFVRRISEALRKFVAFSMIMFLLGTLYGILVPGLADKFGVQWPMLAVIPLILAIAAYFVTEVAVALFVVLLLGVLLVVL